MISSSLSELEKKENKEKSDGFIIAGEPRLSLRGITEFYKCQPQAWCVLVVFQLCSLNNFEF